MSGRRAPRAPRRPAVAWPASSGSPRSGISIWPTMSSTTPSRIASLLATCLYSDIASTPSSAPRRRIVSAPSPSRSARSTAARRTRSVVSGGRGELSSRVVTQAVYKVSVRLLSSDPTGSETPDVRPRREGTDDRRPTRTRQRERADQDLRPVGGDAVRLRLRRPVQPLPTRRPGRPRGGPVERVHRQPVVPAAHHRLCRHPRPDGLRHAGPTTGDQPDRQHRPERPVRADDRRRVDRRGELLLPAGQRHRGRAARGRRLLRLDLAEGGSLRAG